VPVVLGVHVDGEWRMKAEGIEIGGQTLGGVEGNGKKAEGIGQGGRSRRRRRPRRCKGNLDDTLRIEALFLDLPPCGGEAGATPAGRPTMKVSGFRACALGFRV
jgi:hypothetical protein